MLPGPMWSGQMWPIINCPKSFLSVISVFYEVMQILPGHMLPGQMYVVREEPGKLPLKLFKIRWNTADIVFLVVVVMWSYICVQPNFCSVQLSFGSVGFTTIRMNISESIDYRGRNNCDCTLPLLPNRILLWLDDIAKLSSCWLVKPSIAELRLALILVITPTHPHPPNPGESSDLVTCCSRDSWKRAGPSKSIV